MKLNSWLTQRPRIGIAAAILAAVVVLYFILRPAAVPVDTAILTRGPLKVTVEEEGKTRIKDVFIVSAPIAGRVLRSPLEVGDAVEKNTTSVAAIEPSPPPFLDLRSRSELQAQIQASRAAVDSARAEIAQIEAELDFAEKELERTKSLTQRNVVSERALEKARTDVDARKAALARAKANLTVRQRELESVSARAIGPEGSLVQNYGQTCCLTVTSPVSGRVLEIYKKSEQIVPQGTPLVEIGDPANLEIVVELLSADAVRVKEGAPAMVTAWGGPDLAAKVTRIEPTGFTKVSALGIEEQRVRVLLDLEKPQAEQDAGRLGHGYRVYVRITIHDIDDTLLVPLGALFRHKDEWAVYVDAGGTAELRLIEIGHRDATRAEVTKGLRKGERIVLHPSDRVVDGARIIERTSGD